MSAAIWILLAVVTAWGLAAARVPGVVWATALAAGIGLWDMLTHPAASASLVVWVVFFLIALPLMVAPLRRALISAPLLRLMRQIMPAMSATEREALEAGTVWWEAELFGGDPNWEDLFSLPLPGLSDAEQAFLDGPVEQLCAMLDDWEITHERGDLPPEVWQLHQGAGLLRHDHPEGVRRARILRAGAFRGGHEGRQPYDHRRGHGDGAELAGPGGTAAALRHR